MVQPLVIILFFLVTVLVIGTLVGGVIYRTACASYNGMVGLGKSKLKVDSSKIEESGCSNQNLDSENPYASPAIQPATNYPNQLLSGRGVPHPPFIVAALIVFLTIVCNMGVIFFGGLIFGLLAEVNVIPQALIQDLEFYVLFLNLILHFVFLTFFGYLCLPTTAGRAALVALIFLLIFLALIAVLVGGMAFLMLLTLR